MRNGPEGIEKVIKIDYSREFKEISSSLKDCRNQINYTFDVGTNQNVVKVLSESPVAIHFSGHGVENS